MEKLILTSRDSVLLHEAASGRLGWHDKTLADRARLVLETEDPFEGAILLRQLDKLVQLTILRETQQPEPNDSAAFSGALPGQALEQPLQTTIVSVCLRTNHISIIGEPKESYRVAPHLAQIVNALVEAKKSGSQLVSGPELQELPGCKGKQITREIRKKLAKDVPRLSKMILSSKSPGGYWLSQ